MSGEQQRLGDAPPASSSHYDYERWGDEGPPVASTLTAHDAKGLTSANEEGHLVPERRALVDHDGATHALTGEGFDASEDGTGRGTPIVPDGPTAFVKRHGASSVDDYERWDEADTARTLTGHQGTQPALVGEAVAPTLRGSVGRGGGGQKDDAIAYDTYNASENRGVTQTLTDGESGRPLVHPPTETCPEGAACAVDPQPDGRRYAACGDGVAAPQATWIGYRLLRAMRGEAVE